MCTCIQSTYSHLLFTCKYYSFVFVFIYPLLENNMKGGITDPIALQQHTTVVGLPRSVPVISPTCRVPLTEIILGDLFVEVKMTVSSML